MNETELKIRIYGDPVLRKKSLPLVVISEEERQLFDQMLEIMRESGGVGLAAPQLGINKQMIVVEVEDTVLKIANPKILKRVGSDVLEEGCLSVPDICLKVRRAKKIVLEGLNELAQKINLTLEGLLARVVQHEMDHLIGKLIVDYASLPQKLSLRNKLKQIKERHNEQMQQSKAKSCKLSL
jgi:peptide deformylase